MSSRIMPVIALVVAMLLTGVGTYTFLGAHKSVVRQPPKAPTQALPPPPAYLLTGTLYLSQGGAIYSLSGGQFKQLTESAGWMQPAILPTGSGLLAVKRDWAYADVYQLGTDGHVVAKLTNNVAPSKYSDIGANHWSFYPTLAPDGKTVFMSYDSAKAGEYEVDFGIWQMPLGGTRSQWRQWTYPNGYTGGDVQPVPLSSGGLLYVKYDQDSDGKKAAQIWYKAQRFGTAKALTTLDDDCSEPALSPDGKTLAMICSQKQQLSHLVLADFNGSGIGPLRTVVSDRLVAQPAWSPDGRGIAYLAPAQPDQPFQLWWLPKAAYETPTPTPTPSAPPTVSPSPGRKGSPSPRKPSPSPTPTPTPTPVTPIQITTDLGFDASSPIAWRA
jgi:Tol biopolymer transport system component